MTKIKCNHCNSINDSKDFFCKNEACKKNLHIEAHEIVKEKLSTKQNSPKVTKPKNVQEVKVIDFDMEFSSMVIFIIKWTLASIPAMIILFIIGMVFLMLVGGSVTSLISI